MDFNDVEQLVKSKDEYLKTHDLKDCDLFRYDEIKLTRNPEPRISSLTDRDRYGEYLGCFWHSVSSSPDFMRDNSITFYLRKDDRPAGVWSRLCGMIDNYEIFEYYDGYFTGARYMVMGNNITCMSFAYYVLDGDRVTEIIELFESQIRPSVSIKRMKLDYQEGETVLKEASLTVYNCSSGGYEKVLEQDLTEAAEERCDDAERVIDDQQDLCDRLTREVDESMDLEEIVEKFFDVVRGAVENPEEELTYTAGTNPFTIPGCKPECLFCLMRWTPAEDDEYYQLQLNVEFDAGDEKIPFDNLTYDAGDGDLRDAVLASGSFKALKDKKILSVNIEVVET
ncbi:hypothetical protein SAMN02910456_02427 [Ruminococcaceae bacterium YRB3002]|nr:hypothetical protein SAMN02910456_02427 [Ruminococcaceae bacterium YRB3002]